jgi:hypothetical protein
MNFSLAYPNLILGVWGPGQKPYKKVIFIIPIPIIVIKTGNRTVCVLFHSCLEYLEGFQDFLISLVLQKVNSGHSGVIINE